MKQGQMYFLHCGVFSNVFSKCLPARMRSCIGLICASFLHCGFLSVSSKSLPERMQSHTGCICLIFPHCVFSNVSSNGLPERMQSHIGCICRAFPHCVFSNVYSNGLPEMMQNRIGCICLFSLHYLFPNAFSNSLRLYLLKLHFSLIFVSLLQFANGVVLWVMLIPNWWKMVFKIRFWLEVEKVKVNNWFSLMTVLIRQTKYWIVWHFVGLCFVCCYLSFMMIMRMMMINVDERQKRAVH